eukprot:TRINITY_DN1860_c3_g1_i1.p1 TRINITY_DN1860_c3_g1~~TRINITY_DN1860_c3_g1_i1.p1  ORF type:complete len:945 (+),score=150.64 TRINITY_DN1860_c3_g1_i1:124-2958(+)
MYFIGGREGGGTFQMDDGSRMGSVLLKKRGKNGWHHRYLVVGGGEVQLYKNDQDLSWKDRFHVSDVTSLSKSDKKKYAYLSIDVKGGVTYTLKMQDQDSRDNWMAIIQSMQNGSGAVTQSNGMHSLRSKLDECRTLISELTGTDIKIQFDEQSFATISAAQFRELSAAVCDSPWLKNLLSVFKELESGGHIQQTVSRIVLRKQRHDDQPLALFNRITCVLVLRARLDPEQGVKLPGAQLLLSMLSIPVWQAGVEQTLAKDAQWNNATNRLRHAIRPASDETNCPILLEWENTISEDNPGLKSYISKWIIPSLVDQISRAVKAAINHVEKGSNSETCTELSQWVGGISIYTDRKSIATGNSPPSVKFYRTALDPLKKSVVSVFNKCSGVPNDSNHSLLCHCEVKNLAKELVEVIQQVQMTRLIRQAERISVTAGPVNFHFIINWDTFIMLFKNIGAGAGLRLKVMKTFLGIYPSRVDSVVKSLSEADWMVMSQFKQVIVKFTTDETKKCKIDGTGSLIDICHVLRRTETDGNATKAGKVSPLYIAFDVADLGSYCRGLIAAGIKLQNMSHPSYGIAGNAATRSRSRGSDSSDCLSNTGSELSSENVHSGGGSPVPTPATSHHLDVSQLAPIEDANIPDSLIPTRIQQELQSDPLNSIYPIPIVTLRATITALNSAFSKQGIIDQADKLDIIKLAIVRLRRIFSNIDKARKAVVSPSDVKVIVTRFQEYSAARAADEVTNRIIGTSASADFGRIAHFLLTELLPADVKNSLLSKRHCLLLGLSGTGKSMLLDVLTSKNAAVKVPTIAHRTETIRVDDFLLSMTEVGGGPEERKNWSLYSKKLPHINGIIFVVDSTKESELEPARQYLKEVLHSRHLRRVPLLLLLNNSDTRESIPDDVVISRLKIIKYCKNKKRPWRKERVHLSPHSATTTAASLQPYLSWLIYSR